MTARLSIVLSLALLVLGAFGPALEIHHVLAPADHDGHHHSDNDLCQWVQCHTGSSLTPASASSQPLLQPQRDVAFPALSPLSADRAAQPPSRGPPLS